MSPDDGMKKLHPPPKEGDGAPPMARILSMLRIAHSEMKGLPDGDAILAVPGRDRAMESVRLYALVVAAENGLSGYEPYLGALSEKEALAAISAVPSEDLAALAPFLSYIAKYSRSEQMRLAASFCIEE